MTTSRIFIVVAGTSAGLIVLGALVVFIVYSPAGYRFRISEASRAGQLAQPTKAAPAAEVPSLNAEGALATLGSALSTSPEASNDVVFLAVAAAYGRCHPSHAHDFGAMAARARLPVLAGLGGVLGPHTASRASLLAGIRELSARMPCDGPVDLVVGPFHQRVAIGAYAESFPDSYFDPTLEHAPDEFAGHSLAERAVDECNRVAYAVLPLDAPRAWQCSALRAQARQRVGGLCRAEGASADADATAYQIRDTVNRLPSTCQ